MKTTLWKAFSVLSAAGVVAGGAFAQTGDWSFQCIDPANTAPRSTDNRSTFIANALAISFVGLAGTVTYGGSAGPCYGPTAVTLDLRGRFGFAIGTLGSIQDANPADPGAGSFSDDLMAITPGTYSDPSGNYCYAMTTKNGTKTLFGANGFSLAFVGASSRYYFIETTNDNVLVQLRVDVVGDAIRKQWTLTNLDADTQNLGLWFGSVIGMLTADDNTTDRNGANGSGWFAPGPGLTRGNAIKPSYTVLPAGKPPLTDQKYTRALDPAGFPGWVRFLFGQTSAFGLQVDNGPTPSTTNTQGQSDATDVAELTLGKELFVVGTAGSGTAGFPDQVIPDTLFNGSTAYIQKYAEEAVQGTTLAPNNKRVIVQYFRAPWSFANYALPYAVVVDPPKLLASDATGTNGLRPNPLTIRVYVDNVGGYSDVTNPVALNNVKVTLTLPNGLSLANGETAQKIIPVIPPPSVDNNPPLPLSEGVRFVDFALEADGQIYGDLAFSVKVEPNPGPVKIIPGTIRVSTTPRLNLVQDANLVGLPWTFQDTTIASVLGLTTPSDFQAFTWDPSQQGYVIATSVQRGVGLWIVSSTGHSYMPLSSSPQAPTDITSALGAPPITLKAGWNLISNPYPYAISISQLVGVSDASPSSALTWAQMVSQNIVNGALVYYDGNLQDYVYVEGSTGVLSPNQGYWIYVQTQQNLTMTFPPVFGEFVPGSTRATPWTQSDSQWRLQLTARTNRSQDTQNFVGIAKNNAEAKRLRSAEAPLSPVQNVGLSIEDQLNGKTTAMAAAFADTPGRKDWKVKVTTTEAGDVTLTWPNLTTLPKNLRFRMVDTTTGTSRDLRQTSGYTFRADGPGTRELRISVEPGGALRAVIGNVVVGQSTRDRNAPFTIQYNLSAPASTSIRILSSGGKEVYAVTRGRADGAGENTATWTLKDNANRNVAPGSYRVEIVAETDGGERVRKIVPINVIR